MNGILNLVTAALISLLGHSSFGVRQNTEDLLDAWQQTAQPILVIAMDNKDPEIRRRAVILLERLDPYVPLDIYPDD